MKTLLSSSFCFPVPNIYLPSHKFKIILVCMVLVVTTKVQGQTKIWDKTIGGKHAYQYGDEVTNFDYGTSRLSKILPTSDGGYILAGSSDSDKGNDKSDDNRATSWFSSDYWIVKVDKNGSKIWDKTFGGPNEDRLTVIVSTTDGGYLLGGVSESGKGSEKREANRGNIGSADYWVIKLDENGNQQWDKTVGGSENDYLQAIIPLADGNFLLGGYSYSLKSCEKSQGSYGGSDYWVVKITGKGEKVWDKAIGTPDNDELNAIMATEEGGYLIGGSTPADYKLTKIDSDWNTTWEKTYTGSIDADNEVDKLSCLLLTKDGNYLVGGTSASGKGADKSEANKGQTDYWLIKVDSKGNKIWDKTIGADNNEDLNTIIATTDGGYLLGGSSNSSINGDKTENKKGEQDYWVVKTDATGNKIWDKTLGGVNATIKYYSFEYYFVEEPAVSELTSIVMRPDGTYLLGGNSLSDKNGDKSEDHKGFQSDFWLVKIKDNTSLNTTWNMRFGGSGTDNFTSMIQTGDGGYLSGGYSNSGVSGDKSQNSQGKNDFWIVKSDENGKKLWDKRYGGTHDDYLNRVIQTQDGGYLLGGSSLSGKNGDKTEANQGNRDYWIVKVDAQGNKEWDKTYGGSGYDELKKVVQLPSGDYVLGGYSNSPVSGDKSQSSRGGTDYWIVKISKNGTKLWDKRYGGEADETLGSFTETKEGGFLLGGSSLSGNQGDKSQTSRGGSDFWLVRIDKAGNKIWDKRFGGSGDEVLYSLGVNHRESEQPYYAGDYFVGGTSTSGKGGDKSQSGHGGKDFWFVQLNSNGTLQRDLRYGGSNNDELRSVIQTKEGDYLLAGTSFSGKSGDKTQPSKGESDYWVLRINAFGSKYSDESYGGSESEELRFLQRTPDGGYVLGGRSNSGVSGDIKQASQGGTDYWLVKVAPTANSPAAFREARQAEQAVTPVVDTHIQAYPNPFSNKITITFIAPENQPTTVKVFDSQGREVATLFKDITTAKQKCELEWEAGNRSGGMYLLHIQTPANRNQQKILLMR